MKIEIVLPGSAPTGYEMGPDAPVTLSSLGGGYVIPGDIWIYDFGSSSRRNLRTGETHFWHDWKWFDHCGWELDC